MRRHFGVTVRLIAPFSGIHTRCNLFSDEDAFKKVENVSDNPFFPGLARQRTPAIVSFGTTGSCQPPACGMYVLVRFNFLTEALAYGARNVCNHIPRLFIERCLPPEREHLKTLNSNPDSESRKRAAAFFQRA